MRAIASLGILALLSLSGCLSGAQPPNGEPTTSESVEDPYLLDETFDLATTPMDETWSWSMSPGMSGKVELTFTPNPVARHSDQSICYRLEWPEGAHRGGNNCSNPSAGNVNVAISGTSMTEQSTFYSTRMVPNDFTLRVWNPSGADTAQVQVYVETFAAPAP